ncbi:alcohol oxidase [Hymenopellis radicata]|nr:alcohol oxidase [Hymenopellis radicata]
MSGLALVFCSTLWLLSTAKLFTDFSELSYHTYDYVVVGAGTAGNVIAARLTEDSAISVLVLEAGVADNDILPAQRIPLLGATLTPNTIYDWNYTVVPQPGFNGRDFPYPRGRVLGGSSTVNYMGYSHGSSEDWDRYAALTGDDGWKWDNMEKYARKNEKLVAPADGHNTTGQFDPTQHGFQGPLLTSLTGNDGIPLDEHVLATTQELASEFPFRLDMTGGSQGVLGIGSFVSSIGNGERSSSATAYLHPSLDRPNLDVLINAQVTKLVNTGVSDGLPSFHGVQFAVSEDSPVQTVYATKEVILSAGTIGTPTILLLSGIGNATELEALDIPVYVDNPSVGSNMTDHALVANVYEVTSSGTYDDLLRNSTLMAAAKAQWQTTRTGPLTAGVGNHVGYLRLPDDSAIFETVPDPSAGPQSSHFEILMANLWLVHGVSVPSTGYFTSFSTIVISPTSRGDLKLTSANPFTHPSINPNSLTTEFDIFAMVESVKTVKRFLTASTWDDYIVGPVRDLANATTDAEIEQFARNNAQSILHMLGTASMSPADADWGVVGPDLKVKGAEGLRVVDGSVIPFMPNCHTQGPIYMVAERAADLIKQSQ